MASLITPKKIDLSKINGGYEFKDNSILTAEAMNELAGGIAYNTFHSKWDFVFTDFQELTNNIRNIQGNVLIKNITISSNLNFPQFTDFLKTKNVVFENCVLAQSCTINLNGWSMSGLYLESNATVIGGVNVSNCQGQGIFQSIYDLSNCDLNIAEECKFVHDMNIGTMEQKLEVIFENCIMLTNIESNSNETLYMECHGLNNISGNNNFIDCTYVDPFTCAGFVKSEDIGKVPLLTNDGSFSTYDLREDEEFLRMLNEGGIE